MSIFLYFMGPYVSWDLYFSGILLLNFTMTLCATHRTYLPHHSKQESVFASSSIWTVKTDAITSLNFVSNIFFYGSATRTLSVRLRFQVYPFIRHSYWFFENFSLHYVHYVFCLSTILHFNVVDFVLSWTSPSRLF